MRINLPTWLTLFRVLLLPVMVVVFYLPFRGHNLAAAVVFVTRRGHRLARRLSGPPPEP